MDIVFPSFRKALFRKQIVNQDIQLPMKEMPALTGILNNIMERNMEKTKISII
jgi:hypothetical protein